MYPAIRVSGLSKLYRVGARQQGYTTLRESIADAFWSPVNRIRQSLATRASGTDGAAGRRGATSLRAKSEACSAPPQSEIQNPLSNPRLTGENFWALQDVSFEVQPGEVVGIIGRNGAGKSTLLKILSRITEPTSGRVELRGRVGSLLEVGTGFHPELTGRENIYMNGSILGMSRREIQRKFDEIVAFAEIEDFLDTPVKRYSSGMYVRLAFAVAAHLEPEILIVDEVLAVGDQAFQRKCLGKMQDVARHGRTVLFVSHNMGALQTFCSQGILVANGRKRFEGAISDVVYTYLTDLEEKSGLSLAARDDRSGVGEIRVVDAEIRMAQDAPRNLLATGQPATFVFHFNRVRENMDVCFTIIDHRGVPVSYLSNWPRSRRDSFPSDTRRTVACTIDELPLRAGRYQINIQVTCDRVVQDLVEAAASFDVEHCDYAERAIPYPSVPGVVCIAQQWTTSVGSH
jgi:lipopolysaccharide transport system ATP-binding protein